MIYIDKLLPWKRKKTVERKTYSYEFETVYEYQDSDEVHAGIRIKDGPYKDLLYAYKEVKLIEEGESLRVKFEWIPLENKPENDTQDLYDVLGDILVDIIDKNPPDESGDTKV